MGTGGGVVRAESQVLAIAWIPSEAVSGLSKLGFEHGPLHYDAPPPDVIADLDHLERLRAADAFRFANHLTGWIEVDGGRIVAHGQGGAPKMGATTLELGLGAVTFAGVLFDAIVPPPEVSDDAVTFRQTCGGCTGVPAPRPVRHKPFVQYRAPTAWTTLALTLRADGSATFALEGASAFPRHWIYGNDLHLAAKTGTTDYKNWFKHSFGERTPWGEYDSATLVTEVESAYERQLSSVIMGKGKPKLLRLKAGEVLWEQGDAGDAVCLLLDGVLDVVVGGEPVAQVGPGALLGERAVLEGGWRTATLRAATACRVAEARDVDLDRQLLAEISKGHRREADRQSRS